MTTLPMPTGDFAPQPKALPASPPRDASQLRTATLRLRALRESGVKLSRVSRLLGGSPTPIILGRLAGAMTAADYDVPVMVQGALRKKTCIGETECIALNEALARMWKDFGPAGARVVRLDPPRPKAAPRAEKKPPAPATPPPSSREVLAGWIGTEARKMARRHGVKALTLTQDLAAHLGLSKGSAHQLYYGTPVAQTFRPETLARAVSSLVALEMTYRSRQ